MLKKILPNYKNTCLIVGITLVLLSASLFAKGLINSMAEFKVPDHILQSPHYFDAIFWVYLHMIVIGILIIVLGYSVIEPAKQKWIALILFMVNFIYTFLDFRSSDSAIGNGLYQGDASIIPAFISLIISLLFLQLFLRLALIKARVKELS